MRILLIAIVLFISITCAIAQRSIGSGTSVITQGVTASQVSDSLTEVRTVFNDSFADIRNTINNIDVSANIAGDTAPNFIVGDLKALYPSYTYNQLKTIRQANWEALQAACNYVIANGGRVVLPSAHVELHVNDGETITIGSNKSLSIMGSGKSVTKLIFYPIVKLYDVDIFTATAAGSSIYIKGVTLQSTPYKAESYNVVIRPGGVTNQIQITDANISATAVANFVGSVIYVASDQTTTPNSTYTISGYNPTSKILTTTTTISGSNNDVGYIGFDFHEDTPSDTINQYGQYWLKNDRGWFLIEATQTTNNVEAQHYFEDVSVLKFDLVDFRSSGDITFTGNNCYFSGHYGAIFWYSNNETNNHIKLTNTVLEDNSHVVFAYMDAPYTAGNLYGSAIYSHPNTQWTWMNVDVINNNAAATRQYSSGGSKPTPSYASSHLTNVRFINNAEYACQTSQDMTVNFTNCYLEGTYFLNYKNNFTNCIFKGATLSTYSVNSVVNLSQCTFSSSIINIVGESVTAQNCTFETRSDLYGVIDAGGLKKLHLKDCIFTDNPVTRVSGNSVFGYFFPPNLIIDGCEFLDTDSPLWWRWSPNQKTKSIFKTAQIKNTRIVNPSWFGVSNQVIVRTNLNMENCIIGNIEDWGWQQLKPREAVYKTVLTGTTVSTNLNYDHYYTSGTIDKINAPGFGYNGIIYFTADATTTFTAYNSSTKTTSNVDFSQTLAAGETVKMYYDALDIRAASTTAVTGETLGTTTNNVLSWGSWSSFDFGNNYIKPKTVTVTVGAVTLTDDGNGNLTGTGANGWIDYYGNYIVIYFDSNPGATPVTVNYTYHNTIHQTGMWKRVD